jgi:post-segregation antitoxin (ccd killing protein)
MNVQSKSTTIKKAVNLSIDAAMLEEAKLNGVNLSGLLEKALNEDRAKRWLADNSRTIELYNEDANTNGIWSDGERRW